MKVIKQLCYIFPRKQRLLFVALFFLQLIETMLDFAGISLILPFVQVLAQGEALRQEGWFQFIANLIGADSTKSVLLFLTFLMMGIYVVKNAYILLLVRLRINFISSNQVKMGARMISSYMKRSYTFHLQRNTAEIVRNINQDIGGAFSVISTVFTIISDVLIVIALVVYLVAVDLWLTIAISGALLFCSLVYFSFVRKKLRKLGKESRQYGMQMIKAIHQSMGGIKEVKVMGREKFFADVYTKAGADAIRCKKTLSVVSGVPGRLIEALCMCSVLGLVAGRIMNGNNLAVIIPTLSAFALAAMRLMPRANSINGCISSITFTLPSLEALYDDMREAAREQEEEQAEIARKKAEAKPVPAEEEQDIILRDISYTYPNKDEPVLQGVNLRIPKGTSVGIIGVTGAGKTTLVDVILGLLKPQTGTVCYGALDIHADYAQWQEHIGYIPQNIYLVDDSIRNNIALGVDAEKIDEKAIWRALENAQLADFVRSLKDGLDTVIGERGVRISGGQRQRIGIARALYYDPEILFFDEATSSLDNETEAAVMESINSIGGGKTMIIVAHRLTTITHCDKIFKVVDGQVIETTLE